MGLSRSIHTVGTQNTWWWTISYKLYAVNVWAWGPWVMSWGYRNPRHLWIRKYKHCGNLEKKWTTKVSGYLQWVWECVCVCMRPANAFLSDWTVLELTVGIVLVNSIHSCIVQSISISQIHPHVTESHWVLLMVWASPLEGQRSCDHIQTVHWQLHNSSNLRWDKWYLILGADSSPHAMYTMQQLFE